MQNPALLSANAHVTATKESEITAGLRANPNFTASGSDVSLPASSNNPYFYSANVSRLFERGQKRRWRLDVAHSTTDVTRSQYADQERQVVLAVRTAFTQMLAAKGALNLAKQNVDDYRKTIYLAAQQAVRVADANVKLANAEGTTDPTIGGEYDRAGTENSAGFQIGIPLRIFDRNQGEKARTKYEAQSSRFAETAARNQVVSDVDQAWAAYEDTLSLARRYNGHYLQEAHEVRDNLEYSYRHGGTTLLDYLSALQDYRQVNLDALNANMQVWLSIHQVSFAAATEIVP
jgi:outer membrane protein TolC